jgi:hypothetical protein
MRYCNTPADLVTLLNTAAAAGGDNATLNPFWVAGDVKFAYNTTTNQITFTGQTASTFLLQCGLRRPKYFSCCSWNSLKGCHQDGESDNYIDESHDSYKSASGRWCLLMKHSATHTQAHS